MDFRKVANRKIRRPILEVEDLSASDLSLAGKFSYDEYQAEGIDQPGVSGQGSLQHVVISRSSLAESRIADVELMDVVFRDVVMSNASWERVTARRVEMIGCQAVGLQLEILKAEDLYLEECRLDYARLLVEQRRGTIVFHRCSLKEASLGGDLSEVVFSECDFSGAEFQARRAVHCDLTSSRLMGASGLVTLAGATITEDQAAMVSSKLATEIGLVVTSAAYNEGFVLLYGELSDQLGG